MKQCKVPEHIVTTINTLLAPYGETYGAPESPAANLRPPQLSLRSALEYTQLSRSVFYREIRRLGVQPVKANPASRAKPFFRVEDLDRLIASRT